jgi:hypothetical protein
MRDLISGLEMTAAFLLTPVVLTVVMVYCDKHVGRPTTRHGACERPTRRSKSDPGPLRNYFFTRLVWLATHSHLSLSKIQVSVNRPKWS